MSCPLGMVFRSQALHNSENPTQVLSSFFPLKSAQKQHCQNRISELLFLISIIPEQYSSLSHPLRITSWLRCTKPSSSGVKSSQEYRLNARMKNNRYHKASPHSFRQQIPFTSELWKSFCNLTSRKM